MSETISFWESFPLWRDAMIVSVLSAAVLSYLGVWVTLKRVTYVPLALSQVSSLGVVAAFLLHQLLDRFVGEHQAIEEVCDPAWFSLLFALLTAFWFARPRGDSSTSVVVAYLLAGAAVLILGGFVRQDLHDLQSILFGNAVLVETIQILYVGAAALLVLGIHLVWYRRFLFVSFDPDSAGASGIPLFRMEVLLYFSFALMISVATRALGALPAFGLTILPALVGLGFAGSMLRSFTIAILVGIFSAAVGYYLSFVLELPTGACMVGVAGLVYLVGIGLQRSRRAA
jgi:ABC-type Mn2+/Zn2+ transport system permease subunit